MIFLFKNKLVINNKYNLILKNNIMNVKISLYQILEIETNASTNEIRDSYKRLVIKYHPDKMNKINISEEEKNKKFVEIKNAYDILSDREKRKRYDIENNINMMNFNYINNPNNSNYNISMLYEDIKSLITNNEYLFLLRLIEKKFKYILNSNLSNKEQLLNYIENINIISLLTDNFVNILDVNIQIEFTIYELYNNKPKKINYDRELQEGFEEYIYPLDRLQIYENEGEQIIINNKKYEGNMIINVLIIDNEYKNITYHIVGNDIYIKIKSNEIINNQISINYLDNNEYTFDLDLLENSTSDIGKIYCINEKGLAYYASNSNLIDITECDIKRGNLFFIIII
jgi:hypothetical protein